MGVLVSPGVKLRGAARESDGLVQMKCNQLELKVAVGAALGDGGMAA